MFDEKKRPESEEDGIKAPVSEICGNAKENAAKLIDDDSDVTPTQGFFLTSQRWH